jgi:predicted AAA+ superfamily ATPase
MQQHIKRVLKHKLLKALEVSPIVYLNGARQVGKSTLVPEIF